MKKYKYELSIAAFNNLAEIDKIYYYDLFQYKEPDPDIWVDCNFDIFGSRSYEKCLNAKIETRKIYRLKQI